MHPCARLNGPPSMIGWTAVAEVQKPDIDFDALILQDLEFDVPCEARECMLAADWVAVCTRCRFGNVICEPHRQKILSWERSQCRKCGQFGPQTDILLFVPIRVAQ